MTTPRPAAILLIAATTALSQTAEIGQVPRVHVPAPAHWYEHLEGPFYMPSVPHADLKNSPRIYDLIRAGVLYLSLSDAIALAIENNLDVEIERYSQPIADLDVIRAIAPLAAHKLLHKRKRELATVPNRPLPPALVKRAKSGFSVPLHQWMPTNGRRERGLRGWARRLAREFGFALQIDKSY